MLLSLAKLMFTILNFFIILCTCEKLEFRYHPNDELEAILKNFSQTESLPLRKKLYSVGESSGRPSRGINPSQLWVLELTAAPEDKIGVPNVKLVGNIHGTEPVGREALLHLIEYLIEEYGKNENVTWLLDNTRLHISPNFNPDGFEVANVNFCRGCYDCPGLGVTDDDIVITSNFPDYFQPLEILDHAKETLVLMKWLEDIKFVLSGSFLGSFIVAIYPYFNRNGTFGENLTPDDDVFKYLASTYSQNHPIMKKGLKCPKSQQHFDGGISNGASWHTRDGDMSDFHYIFRGCMDVRLEISCCKYPDKRDLKSYWDNNKEAMVQYSMQANRGVTGQILDAITKTPVEAKLKIAGRNMPFTSFKKTGEFWRILLPGNYTLEIEAKGYYSQKKRFTVKDYGKSFPKLTNLTIFLLNSTVSTTTSTTSSTSTKTTITTTLKTSITTMKYQTKKQNNNNYACCYKQSPIFIILILCFKFML